MAMLPGFRRDRMVGNLKRWPETSHKYGGSGTCVESHVSRGLSLAFRTGAGNASADEVEAKPIDPDASEEVQDAVQRAIHRTADMISRLRAVSQLSKRDCAARINASTMTCGRRDLPMRSGRKNEECRDSDEPEREPHHCCAAVTFDRKRRCGGRACPSDSARNRAQGIATA